MADDLAIGTKAGEVIRCPKRCRFTLAGALIPVVAGGRVFIGDIDGKVYGLSLDDGRTLWIGENPGGTCAALAVVGDVVVATAIPGGLTAFALATGRQRWRVETPKAITRAARHRWNSFSGGHDGRVYAVEASSGKLLWTSADLGASIVGELCGDANAIYVGAEICSSTNSTPPPAACSPGCG